MRAGGRGRPESLTAPRASRSLDYRGRRQRRNSVVPEPRVELPIIVLPTTKGVDEQT